MADAKARLEATVQENAALGSKNSALTEFQEKIFRIASEFYSKLPEELKEAAGGKIDGELHIANFKSATTKLRAGVWSF